MQKPNFEEYRNKMKQKDEGGQNYLIEDDFQEADHPSAFINTIKSRTHAASRAKDDRRQILPSRVVWDGSLDRFEEFRNKVEGHYGQIGAGYLFDSDFQEAHFEKGADCYINFLDEVPSASQIKKDARALYGALLSACQSGVGRRIMMKNRSKQDGFRS
jgi:hypothetical protein